MIVKNNEFVAALDQAHREYGIAKSTSMRIFGVLSRRGYVNYNAEKSNITKLMSLSDKKLAAIPGIGEQSFTMLKRALDILNGADSLETNGYTIHISAEDAVILRRMIRRKKDEIRVLGNIVSSLDYIQEDDDGGQVNEQYSNDQDESKQIPSSVIFA